MRGMKVEEMNQFLSRATIGIAVIFLCAQVGYAQLMDAEPEAPLSGMVQVDPERDGVGYRVSDLVFMYPFEHDELPDLELLDDVVVLLSPTADGFVGVVDGQAVVAIAIGDIGDDQTVVIYGSALAAINQAVRNYYESEHGLIGHLVTPDASEIAYQSTREDLRAEGDTELTIMIWRAVIGDIRTVALGDRVGEREQDLEEGEEPVSNVNRQEHRRLLDRVDIEQGALLTRESVDRETHRLNRHPGRRADVAIGPSDKPGEVVVDFMISEPKQWNVYVQTSNTGTESTNEWQQRFGYVNRQLTGRDDVFTLDYVTTQFDAMHAVLGSYTFDFGPKNRMKIFGRWNEYTAKDVGLGFENFKGDGYSVGVEIARNVWQDGPKFVDVVAGVKYDRIHVENRLFLIEGEDNFFLPYIGVRFEKRTPIHSAFGEVTIESNWASVAGTSQEDVTRLGRFGADEDFTVLRAQLSHSFYLEPIFMKERFSGSEGVDGMTLAHEVVLKLRGQYSFQSRLVPNYQFVAGGFYTVRGYDESSAVGDDGVLGTAEYRFHLGRSLPARADTGTLFGKPFRTARARPYGSADWDVIFKGFVDVARLGVNDAPFFERAETLVGAGVGIETQLKSNFTLKLDYGMALTNLGQGAGRTTNVGDTRLHFSAQFVF